MSSPDSLTKIKTSISSARKHAYIGLYEESLKSFKTGLDEIKRVYKLSTDHVLIEEWKKTEREIMTEMQTVTELCNIVKGLKGGPGKTPISGSHQQKNQREQMIDDEEYSPYGDENAKKYPFDRKPFAHHQQPYDESTDDPYGYDPSPKSNNNYDNRPIKANNNQQQPHYVYVKADRKQNQMRQEKDPDIWDPPSPKGGNNQHKQQQPNDRWKPKPVKKQPEKKAGGKPSGNNSKDNKKNDGRDYAKPWLVPEKKKDDKKDQGDGKKSFLDHIYQDGKGGPDEGLVQMLEKEVIDMNPNVKWEDIADLENAKNTLQEAVLLPLLCPEIFVGVRRPWSGVLMFGPPGTGKTMLAKAVATQGKTTFFNITASSFASKWRGESERLVRLLFEMARFYAPTTIFIDEIDSLGGARGGPGEHETSRRVLSELLIQMDGLSSTNSSGANEQANEEQRKTLTVIAATNRPWDLDEALRRRLEKRIYIPLPNEKGREELFKINLNKIKLDEDVDHKYLVQHSEGYSGADIATLCREASMMPIRKKLLAGGGIMNQLTDLEKLKAEIDVPISMNDFKTAFKNVHKSVSNTDLGRFTGWMKEFGSS